jgi:succinoglycan biosynthesis transport protein ExoP
MEMTGDKEVTSAGRPAGANQTINLGLVRSALCRRPLLTAGVVLAAALAGAAVWFFLPEPKLTGYVLFQIHSRPPHILNPQQSQDFNTYRLGQASLVKDRVVLSSALSSKPELARAKLLDDWQDKVSGLENLLKVDFKAGPEFMRLSLEGDDRQELESLLKTVAERYLERVVNHRKSAENDRWNKLENHRQELDREVKALTASIQQKTTGKIATSGPQSAEFLRDRRAHLLRTLMETTSYLQAAEVELSLLDKPAPADAGFAPGAVGGSAVQSVDSSLRSTVTTKRSGASSPALASAIREILRGDPDYQAVAQKRDQIRMKVEATRKAAAPNSTPPGLLALEAELKALESQCSEYEGRARAEAEDRLRAVPAGPGGAELAYAKALDRVQLYKKLKEKVENDLEEVSVAIARGPGGGDADLDALSQKLALSQELLLKIQAEQTTIQVERDAPDRVSKVGDVQIVQGVEGYKRAKYGTAAALGVLFLGCGGLVLLERRNPRVLDSRQVAGELGLPLIGILPAMKPEEPILVPTGAMEGSNWQLAMGEAVHMARAVLQYGVSPDRPARTILVGSALSGEGKSSLAALLAHSMAQSGHRTLLIDGDLRRPSLHTSLSLPPGPGLCEYLSGQAELSDILRPTAVPGLAAVTAGRWTPVASHALATPRWKDLLTQAAVEYDYVIIDSAPILPVADTLLMARPVDGVLLSVMRHVSELPAVKDALAQLALLGTRVLGVVLSRGSTRTYYRPRYEARPLPDEAPAGQVAG